MYISKLIKAGSESNSKGQFQRYCNALLAMGWELYDDLDPLFLPAWQPSIGFNQGDKCIKTGSTNSRVYECMVGGTTGTVEPVWPTTDQQTVVDNDITWKCLTTCGHRIFRSNGEDNAKLWGYIKFSHSGDLSATFSNLYIEAYAFWNKTTHAGYSPSYYNASYRYLQMDVNYDFFIYGSKDLVLIDGNTTSWVYRFIFGHIPHSAFPNFKAVLQAPAASGSNVVVAVDDASMLATGTTYQIFNPSTGDRDNVSLTAVSQTSITIASLPRAYGADSIIGAIQLLFGAAGRGSSDNYNLQLCCAYGSAGTAMASANDYTQWQYMIGEPGSNPDAQLNRYVLMPVSCFGGSPEYLFGYVTENIFKAPWGTNWDLFGVKDGPDENGTVSAGATSTTFTCGSKSWTVNQWAGKIVLIATGTGAGQTRMIASNTANQLTVDWPFTTTPSTDSVFWIVDEVYRRLYLDYWACKEIIKNEWQQL